MRYPLVIAAKTAALNLGHADILIVIRHCLCAVKVKGTAEAVPLLRKNLLVVDAVHEGAEFARTGWVAQLAQGLRFDLADALAGDGKGLADFFQRVFAAIFEAEAHLDDLLFARGQGAQDLRGLVLEVHVDDGLGGRDYGAILDEISKVRIFLFTDWSFERDGLLGDLQDLADLGDRDVHAAGNLFAGWLAAQLLHQLTRGADAAC